MSARTPLGPPRDGGALQAFREDDEIVIEVRYPDITPFDFRVPANGGLEQLVEQLQEMWFPETVR
ncbi:hypothetical protein [Kineococcus sp. R86509]|uniref:hypothetical protein n=1 Tax=Kineococcus sp. R86509 TaxID=3093851 RepID=UPI0036D3F882